MKNEQLHQARQLYFQTGLNKSEIADNVGISRRTLHYWIRQNNWDRMKQAGEVIPSFLAENVYQVIGRFTDHLLSAERKDKPITPQEAGALYKLTLTIGKLKTRATVNESMETFMHFNDYLCQTKPEIAAAIEPHIGQFIAHRANVDPRAYAPAQLNHDGYISAQDPAIQEKEAQLDADDLAAWLAEQEAKGQPAPKEAAKPEDKPQQAHATQRPVSVPGRPAPQPSFREIMREKALAKARAPQPVAA